MRKLIIVFVLFMGFMDNIMAQNPDYLFMIENACKAPSGHNTQPWLFKIRESEIDIYPDLSKELPVVDQVIESYLLAWGAQQRIFVLLLKKRGIRPKLK